MTAWYEDNGFWLGTAELLFSVAHWERAPAEVSRMIDLLKLERPAHVLDIPCGPGRHSIERADGRSTDPAMVWNGQEYGMVWDDSRDGVLQVYFARIGHTCNKIGSEILVSQGHTGSGYPSIARTERGHGVTWWDMRDGNHEVYFASLDNFGVELR